MNIGACENSTCASPVSQDINPDAWQCVPFVQVNLSLLDHDVREPPTHTTDHGQCEHHLATSINIGVEDTQDVLKLVVRYY